MSAHMQSDPQRLSEFLALLAKEQRGAGAVHLALVLEAASASAQDLEDELDALNRRAIPDVYALGVNVDVYALGDNVVAFRRNGNA